MTTTLQGGIIIVYLWGIICFLKYRKSIETQVIKFALNCPLTDDKMIKNYKEKGFMNKKVYEQPEVEVISFEKTDVMLSSGNKGYQSDPFDNNPFEGV